jgi:phage-related protein
MDPPAFRLEFYEDQSGIQPVRQWLVAELSPDERRTVGAAMRAILQQQGIGVCGSGFGRQLGGGLFEFRLRERPLIARVFCHAYGDRVILLLGGYDKGRDPSSRRQEREIALARSRLTDWNVRHRR